MEKINQLNDEIVKSFDDIKRQIDLSFSVMDRHPETKKEIQSLWKDHILDFIAYTMKTGEKYDNKDVFKAITKSMLFGK